MSDTDVGFWLSLNACFRDLSDEELAAIAERVSKRMNDAERAVLIEYFTYRRSVIVDKIRRLEQLRRYQMICGLAWNADLRDSIRIYDEHDIILDCISNHLRSDVIDFKHIEQLHRYKMTSHLVRSLN